MIILGRIQTNFHFTSLYLLTGNKYMVELSRIRTGEARKDCRNNCQWRCLTEGRSQREGKCMLYFSNIILPLSLRDSSAQRANPFPGFTPRPNPGSKRLFRNGVHLLVSSPFGRGNDLHTMSEQLFSEPLNKLSFRPAGEIAEGISTAREGLLVRPLTFVRGRDFSLRSK